MARAVVFTCAAAIVVFAVVQDRVTVAGVGQYVSLQREALSGRRPAVTIDEVMEPVVSQAIQRGAMWGGVVFIGGLGGTLVARRRRRRE